ncbi:MULTISPECIES: response regulator [Nostocales]|uniref:Response regulator n=3 Tax=Nostocales TaxID=1161 RepID=A0A0C1RLT6_9CYAN|nr:response regulator [Tolypothrix bouteillei]KAF3888156.1 response regulator [Tolypothrix bouteillei VB521301]
MANLKPFTILLVENHLPELRLIQRIITKARLPISLQFVENGLSALTYLSEIGLYSHRDCCPVPHLIVLADLILPDINGIELITWIEKQSHLKDIPVIATISSASPNEIAELDRMEIQHFAKPTSINDWQKLIKRIMSLVSTTRVETRVA